MRFSLYREHHHRNHHHQHKIQLNPEETKAVWLLPAWVGNTYCDRNILEKPRGAGWWGNPRVIRHSCRVKIDEGDPASVHGLLVCTVC